MDEARKTWSVVDVGHHLQHSTGKHAFEVMRVSDHEEKVDKIVDGAALAVKHWREKFEALEAVMDQAI